MNKETGIIESSLLSMSMSMFPKHPEYALESTRLDTFKNWPIDIAQKPLQLAECGFYYLGRLDLVRCFFCGGELWNWEPSEVPWVEHARYFQSCGFWRQEKDLPYIQELCFRWLKN